MAKLKFYTDEHIALAVAFSLRQRGIDAISAKDAQALGLTDEAQLALATTQGRVLVTKDKDFSILHAAGHPHAGIAFGRWSKAMCFGLSLRGAKRRSNLRWRSAVERRLLRCARNDKHTGLDHRPRSFPGRPASVKWLAGSC